MSGQVPPIAFWFDFASGYAWFAAQQIEALGARVGRPVAWRPYMLGTAFKATGMRGLSEMPLKKDYARRDWQRIARRYGTRFAPPAHHPVTALAATRAFYWIEAAQPETAPAFARALFDAYFARGIDITDIAQLAELAAAHGLPRDALAAAIADPALKARVKKISEDAVSAGIFGSPFFIVDDEPFWGWDRMAMMEDWIRGGGW